VIGCLRGMGVNVAPAPLQSGFSSVLLAWEGEGREGVAVALDVERPYQYLRQPHTPNGDIVFRRRLLRAMLDRGDYSGLASVVPSEWRTARTRGTTSEYLAGKLKEAREREGDGETELEEKVE
jgi:hypothetical protein